MLIARGGTEHVDLGFSFPDSSSHHVVLSKAGLGELPEPGPDPHRGFGVQCRMCLYVYMHICIYLYNRCAPRTRCCFSFGGKTMKCGSKHCYEFPARQAGRVSFVCPGSCRFLSAAGKSPTASVRLNHWWQKGWEDPVV